MLPLRRTSDAPPTEEIEQRHKNFRRLFHGKYVHFFYRISTWSIHREMVLDVQLGSIREPRLRDDGEQVVVT